MPRDENSLYPSDQWLSLLKACLVPGRQGEKAWNDWQAAAGGPSALLGMEWAPAKRWWPLLWTALCRNRLDVSPDIRIPLKSACVAETIRYARCRRIVSNVLSTLGEFGFEPVLVKGMALAETVYEQPFLRHCHGADVWIRTGDPQRAAVQLAPSFLPEPGNDTSSDYGARLVHRSGLPLRLRGTVFEDTLYFNQASSDQGDALHRDTLPPEYVLTQVCREAGQEEDFRFDWISDGCKLLQSRIPLDRERLSSIFSRSRSSSVLRERIEYLYVEFSNTMPAYE